MKTFDEYRHLSEQDGGPFLEVATVYEDDNGTYCLRVSAGYGSEGINDLRWYELFEKPKKALAECAIELDPLVDQCAELGMALGVAVKLCDQSTAYD